ncbi:MAG TPA: filamentous hemagglutinin N-terminal domain-containing protein, partial [Sedimentisphaerales bacterium]|nr:filamentous hemagglutinin N-terminal domain-containing protein [Sedimentisphaerales bacterium]
MGRVHVLSRSLCLRQATAWMLIYCISFATPVSVALGGIENPKVISGQVAFQQSGGNTTITASDQSIINYSRFDIAAPETVQFIQPGSTASVLNRILSANPSRIDGTLLANGRVFFINPAGVIIGGSATINVNQLVASGLNMSDGDFLSERYQFAGGNGSVVNAGDISAQSVYLVGKEATNTGTIRCPGGYVVMAAGDTVFLGQPGSDIVVEVGTLGATEKLSAESASQIINEGQIELGSGSVVLAAAGDIFSRPLLKNTGSISACVAEGDAGRVSLKASGGEIDNAGIITANSVSGAGGVVTAEADEVVNSGTIDVSGFQGGGVVLAGTSRAGQFGLVNADGTTGDGGSIEIRADEVVALGTDSLTSANAGQNGDGGDIIAYSPGTALLREGAQVEAKGGSESGDGGFFELSGKEYVEIAGGIDLTAANGQEGEFLIDPLNIKIVPAGAPEEGGMAGGRWTPSFPNGGFSSLPINLLEGYLGSGDVTISTSVSGPPADLPIAGVLPPPTQDGWVVFDAGRAVHTPVGNSNSLRVDADAYIRLISGIDFRGSGDVILNAGSHVRIDAPVRLRGGGAFVARSGLSDTLNANILANNFIIGGSILLDARRGDNSQVRTQDLTATSGDVDIFASDNTIRIEGNIDTATFNAGDIILHNNTIAADGVLLDAGGDVVLAKDKTMTGLGALTIEAGNNISLGKDLAGHNHSGGDVTTRGDMTLTAGDDIEAYGDLTSVNGSVSLYSSDDTTHLGGNVTASTNVLLNNNTRFEGAGNQRVNARTGTLTANGSLEKTTNGSLYLHSSGDMSVADHLAAVSGGVSLVSDTGRIHSDGAGTLNVPITGSSDGTTGVDLPGGGKAAIVVISKQQDLNLGGGATLTANGAYDPTVYDDRASINFKNAGANHGVPIDVAIYLASFDQATGTGASVNASSPVNVANGGAMVIDAFDTVTFGGGSGLKDSLLNKTVDHLELCSRISTSLADASLNGRLPDLWVNYYT